MKDLKLSVAQATKRHLRHQGLRKFLSLMLLGLFYIGGVQAQTTYYVTEAGAGNKSGSSWDNASDDLQAMINGATVGNKIFVAKGTYKPERKADAATGNKTPNDQNNAFVLKEGVKLYGGFAGGEQTLANRDLSIVTNKTILSGDLGIVGNGNENDNAYHVVISVNTTAATVLDGFTITGGNAILSGGSISVGGNTIYKFIGGGMYNTSSSPSITNTTFSGNNAANNGGGMYNNYSSPSIMNTTFRWNNADNNGGGMYNDNSDPSITNTTFNGNNANNNGGGMYNHFSSPSITNTTFGGNIASNNGGGMYNHFSNPKIYNSIFWGNTKGNGSSASTMVAGADIQEEAGNAVVQHCLTQKYGIDGQKGNKVGTGPSNDPKFVNAASGDLRLQLGSPAINAGDNTKITGVATDAAGNPRIHNSIVDMGAYESTPCDQGYTNNRIYVNASATGSADGKAWATAYTNLQDAIDKAVSCNNLTEIWVAKGTYKPSKKPRTMDKGTPITTSTDARDVTFHLINGVRLYGGFAGTEGTLADRDLSIVANKTILSGDLNTGIKVYHVVISVSDTDATILDGFTITEGNANGSGSITNVEGKTIYQNQGGGMHNSSSSLIITNTTFNVNTTSNFGGGMYNGGSSPAITNTTFNVNTTSNFGGGMYNDNSSPTITNTTFSGNAATNNGGGMCNDNNSFPMISNTTFSRNIASSNGGGMFNSSSSPKIYNSIFWDNKKGNMLSAIEVGADIQNHNSTPNLEHSLLQLENNATNYSGVTFAAPNNNVYNKDPLFVDISNPAGADGIFGTADDGLRLQCNSPAINKGNNNMTITSTDIRGVVRQQGGRVDMGAYEGGRNTSPVSDIANTSLPTTEGVYVSDYAFEQGGLKHYCTCDNKLLLSLGTNSNVPDDGVSLKIGTDRATLYPANTGFITNTEGAALINRTWDAKPNIPLNGEVLVRHYFTAAEFAALNGIIPGGIAVNQMKLYKATKAGAHLPVADIASSEVIMLDHGTTPSTTVWQSGAFNTSNHYAEFKVSSFSGGGGGGAKGGASLPVELMYFQAEKDGKDALLTWATASEENNKGFEVEHSTDGRAWSNIGRVDGHGNSAEVQNYKFAHDTPQAGVNYYRLKQTDFDGAYEYSEVRMVSFDSKMSFIITPNPSLAGRKNSLMLYAFKAAAAEVQIYSIQGKLSLQQSIEVVAGNQLINLPTRDLPAGTYTIRLVSQQGTQSALLIKN